MSGKVEKVCSEPHEGDVTAIAYCNKTGLLYSAGADTKVKVWDKALNLKNEHLVHEGWIYCIAVNDNGKVYTGSCDGSLRAIENPLEKCEPKIIFKSQDEIESVYVVGPNVYSGDDKGVVTFFEDDRFKSRLELSEEVRGMIVVDNYIYTVRDRGMSINCFSTNKHLGGLLSRGSIEGRAPICIFGGTEGNQIYNICIVTQDGKGIKIIQKNANEKFDQLDLKEEAHEMIINAVAGVSNSVFTADYVGKVKKWTLDSSSKLNLVGEIDVCPGICLNSLVALDETNLYCGGSDGLIRQIIFK